MYSCHFKRSQAIHAKYSNSKEIVCSLIHKFDSKRHRRNLPFVSNTRRNSCTFSVPQRVPSPKPGFDKLCVTYSNLALKGARPR